MKKIAATISIIFGFFGATTLILFFVETGVHGITLPQSTNLTADISANVAPDQSAGTATDTPPAVDSSTDVIAPTAIPPAVVPPVLDTTSSIPSSDAATSPNGQTTTDETVPPPPPPPASPTTIPTPTPPPPTETLTIATPTITVTPTAPALATPPPASPAAPSATIQAVAYEETSFQGDAHWQTTWGALGSTYLGSMDLSAGPESTGGSVYLNTGNSWSDYTMHATVDWIAGRTIGLMADYDNASNYVLCQYAETATGTVTMQLMQYVNGSGIFLSPAVPVTAITTPASGGPDLDLSITVNGTHGGCSFGTQTVSNATIGPGMVVMNAPGSGSVGFTAHDPTPDTSEMIIKSVKVLSA